MASFFKLFNKSLRIEDKNEENCSEIEKKYIYS